MSGLCDQLPLDLPHRPALSREDFLVTPENQSATGWIDTWPEWPGPALLLYGPPASGKTHLLHVHKKRSGARNLSSEELCTLPADALFHASKHCVLDDADTVLCKNAKAQTTLFHLYNLCFQNGGTLVLAAASPVQEWALDLKDLRSRLAAAPAATILPPGDSLLGAILVKLFRDRQLSIPADLVSYVLPRMERSFAFAARLVEEADRLSLAGQKPVTLSLVRQALSTVEMRSAA